tara:strand:- start:257052 stop:257759 length:708 start_codon:yes stop_codon:yes gene_type:complete
MQTEFTNDPAQTNLMDLAGRKIGDLIASFPGATLVFRRHKVGFCCSSSKSLAEVAQRKGFDAEVIARELCDLPKGPLTLPDVNDVDAFIDYILTRYHQTHRDELAELILLARKVEAVHGDHPDVPVGLSDALFEMAEQLDAHMAKEEMVLFPAMRKMCEDGSIAVQLVMPIHCMREEHDDHGEAIHRLQKLTNHFTLPDGVCGSWRALYSGTAKLVEDLVAHIHLENEVLFPRFE